MGIPWRKIATIGFGVGKVVGGKFIPGLGVAIDSVEMMLPGIPGADKKRQVELISDSALDVLAAFKKATPEQVAAIKRARSEAIDAYVAARNAQAAAAQAIEDAKEAYRAFDAMVDTLKDGH